ncbi:MAG: NAD-glutamate dehydrogenase domain-containing protein, partial [Candidatus Rokuibacteriota bacterium]
MPTADPPQRAARAADLTDILCRQASSEDRDLVLSLAPVIFAEMPDRLALGLAPSAVAARILDHFRFLAREIPPTHQLYRGLPGIHVRARNPSEAEARAMGAGTGLPVETTIVETHTVDTPFIFESLKNYFRKAGFRVFAAIHPILAVRRQWGRIVWFGGSQDEGARECYCHFQVERVESPEHLRRIEHEVYSVLKSVFTAVEDHETMVAAVRDLGIRLRSRRGTPGEVEAARAFLDWLVAGNYIFMGTVRYGPGSDGLSDRLHESAAGVFTDPALLPVVFPGVVQEVEARIRPVTNDERTVDIDYCRSASAIYQLEPIDDIIVREWAADGTLAGATLLLGRLAVGAFTQKASEIPLLKEKHDWLLAHSGAMTNSYAYREIRALFNRFPKRELFYGDVQSLKEIIDRIISMTGDDEIAVHRRDGSGYVTLYIAFSRLRYSAKTEADLSQALTEAFGPISFSTSADCGAVTLVIAYFDASRLEHPVDIETARGITRSLVTTWEDRVAAALERAFGEREGRRLVARHVRPESRSGLYRESTPPEEVPKDLKRLERLMGRLEIALFPRSAEAVTLKLYSVRPLGLTDTLRTLQNLGLTITDELRIPLTLPEGRQGFLYRLEVEAPHERIAALQAGEERVRWALRALDEKRATNDRLNGVILQAGLGWREIEVLRTLRNHLLQIRPSSNAETVNGVLLRNGVVAAALFHAFAARFDPGLPGDRAAAIAASDDGVRAALESVQSLAEDEVLRALDNLVRCALRTNFYQRPERPVVAIKVDSRRVEGMPSPRPLCEIYVHSRQLEGIHLRGGRVARGGIRWSDRHDDFRTEILGLMKTQMVKNSIIVPVGAKGGFVLKEPIPGRPALDAYLIDRYREFVAGLLDVTDNIVDGHVLHPPELVRHDGDDPYLVVAADKGTAHLSDTANRVAAQYGFWLGDAFASGGSVGYDHKQVGITARGAWECVTHHFRNLGLDVQKEPFTVCGIGDMAGDVFGNGALRSRCMKLVAAFNHVHIFVDPDPDPGASYGERERLFRLPRSSWRDYDPALMSKGGGVFDRSAKAIPLSPEMRKLLDLGGESASGEEVIRRILTARVDLLYNGGIGTYGKAASEGDAEVGDRANDRVRVNGRDVRARVVAEGGNLGFTQKARLECWARGALINTDAVDNSAGVDMSDHEVNIKILLDLLVKRGGLTGKAERNRLLLEMTEEVAELVLADNANQALALTLDAARSADRYEEFVAFIDDLVAAGVLNRVDDAVPSRDELLTSPERARGLPRPLLAVLLGHTKMWAFERVMKTDFPDSGVGRPFLQGYFPRRLRERFADHLQEHALRRDIVATAAVNHVINQAGVTFLARVMAAVRAGIETVLAAYLEVERGSAAREVRSSVRAAGLGVKAELEALLEVEQVLESETRRALEGQPAESGQALKKV